MSAKASEAQGFRTKKCLGWIASRTGRASENERSSRLPEQEFGYVRCSAPERCGNKEERKSEAFEHECSSVGEARTGRVSKSERSLKLP